MNRIIPLLFFVSPLVAAPQKTALDRYVAKPDPAYKYHLVRTVKTRGATAYILDMTSQKYLTPKEVNRPFWKHWVIITKPDRVEHRTGLLFIGGGSNGGDAPNSASKEMMQIALATRSVVVELKMTPNQPLIFAGEKRERSEDAIIAYTWDKYLKTGDEKWPLRLPMTKAAVRAMDTVTDFLKRKKGGELKVDQFVITGGSKRGWTTWSTAAVDKRVVAIAPIVIDMLNVVPSFRHHKSAYGRYSNAVQDYVDMKIMEWLDKPEFAKLKRIEDPYEYRDRLTMPKFLLNSCGDQFFLPDSWQFYWHDLKGPKHIRYVPNTGHGLKDSDALDSLVSFYHSILNQKPLPNYEWNVATNGTITVHAKDKPIEVRLWQATNPEARIFRIDELGPKWTSTLLKPGQNGAYTARPPAPPKGWTAYMIELTFPGKVRPYKFTSGVVVTPKALPFAK
ncbi:MAG: PhoPQ-activated pathogenicity-related family protein [Verrucomicrobia subdivision 3 bacterium]|nr:PhoPQ-activated pathogenicity-related family protein [Limisphaerales bacterium]